jgi:ABC-type multidrug transport system fused ATPase/permease subunit
LRGLLRYNKKTFSYILIHQTSFALVILLFVQYIGIPQEELQGSESPPRSWPKEGSIEFEHVTMRYKPELPPALSDVSFLIASGMQV